MRGSSGYLRPVRRVILITARRVILAAARRVILAAAFGVILALEARIHDLGRGHVFTTRRRREWILASRARMTRGLAGSVIMVATFIFPIIAHAEWKPAEKIETYAISGQTAPELYASIGERGPQLGGQGRVIAHTTFKLTWTRNYQPQGSRCVLVSAVPKLTIIYTLPKPSASLRPAIMRRWQTFIDGVAAHERVHGGFVTDMVHEIETLSIGFSADDDPGCTKIRAALTARLGEISQRERQRNSDFDRVEMSQGGKMQQLILALVND